LCPTHATSDQPRRLQSQGGLRTAAELADALGLPEEFVALGLEKTTKEYSAKNGGLN
jgi:hypothetical protein